jgi:DNA-binding NarL/FixJ family response regulator
MVTRFHCIWIDDEPERIRRIVDHVEFSRLIAVTVVATTGQGLLAIEAGEIFDVAILDVDGGPEGNICRKAADSELAVLPWILISDLARDELAPKAGSMAMSGYFLEYARTSPGLAAYILSNLCDDVIRGRPAVSRSLIVTMAHDAKNSLDRVRWRLLALTGSLSGLSQETRTDLAQIDSDIQSTVQLLTAIQAQ